VINLGIAIVPQFNKIIIMETIEIQIMKIIIIIITIKISKIIL